MAARADWIELALNPPRAFGAPLARGRLRVLPEDFVVEEELGFKPAGAGSHVLLKVCKRNANTEWVARELARAAGCRPADVGFAGMKDRRAVATQWFSVPQTTRAPEPWTQLENPEFTVLEAQRHNRKLPRGALAGNRFAIRIRDLMADRDLLAARIAALRRDGAPNYFGPQRFGRQAANLERIGPTAPGSRAEGRGFVLSAARSLVFNAVLAERVRDSSWSLLEPGDLANLDGRGSVFAVETPDSTIVERCARLEIHPTGPMWGRGEPPSGGRVRQLEKVVAARLPEPCALCVGARMDQERRSLRLAVHELASEAEGADLWLRFRLTRGSFATTVLRELIDSAAFEDDYLRGEIST